LVELPVLGWLAIGLILAIFIVLNLVLWMGWHGRNILTVENNKNKSGNFESLRSFFSNPWHAEDEKWELLRSTVSELLDHSRAENGKDLQDR
jgi:hypothetical protein